MGQPQRRDLLRAFPQTRSEREHLPPSSQRKGQRQKSAKRRQGVTAKNKKTAKISKCTAPLQKRGAARTEGDHAHKQREYQQHFFFGVQPEFERLP